ncbi:3-oxoacyl-[acyl-carrier-protein] synthase III C-terminal domain-containing protein [Rubrivirga litoralis]|uniref:3-oxoacyl-[acyl-carrier-protein] synthase III C-terminal domain-containing protein n=1 Tax=Rubrivirga litoralis TaxID=3075598 RepID=A0ABU3BUD2_9BACT|nr:3-oxoacyl-[acyl-carrier-protein] synthase III C-terminal domain-containing protein [Rubrivirga sp. F394]MDT0632840.1 3-oxoacyl-[acyl-carrier-protein] synthase III C-terminal domain-containing protein [Rubrivirga sp. F394]
MAPRAYLTARPLAFGHLLRQEDGVAWMKAALQRVAETAPVPDLDRALRLYDLLGRRSAIDTRRTALEDYAHQDWDRMRVHAAPPSGDGQVGGGAAPWYRASLDARMAVFAETAEAIAHDAFAGDAEPPDALLQVSCTGYDSPSAVQRLVAARGWADRTRLLSVGHMGCYAALPALATAADLATATAARAVAAGDEPGGAALGGADARTSVLLVEVCTLHHHPATTDPDRIVQQVLFADGAARLDVTVQPPPGPHFALLDHFEAILPDTLDEMTWRPADGGFAMTLSREVPAHIRAHVAGAFGAFLARNGLEVDDLDVLAVHPGGPRVIESTAEALGVGEDRVRHSQGVLRERGNMSSTTLPHIWDRVLQDDDVPAGALVGSVAFGPGLTVTGNLLRKGGGAVGQ